MIKKMTVRRIFYHVDYKEYEIEAINELKELIKKENIVLPSMYNYLPVAFLISFLAGMMFKHTR